MGQAVLTLALLVLLVALLVATWRAYRWMFREARNDAALARAVVADEYSRHTAQTEFLHGQARRIDCPVCGAPRGQDCRRHKLALRLLGPHPSRLKAYRQAVH
jgi:hypothetical protein